jgi:hypothetical protein
VLIIEKTIEEIVLDSECLHDGVGAQCVHAGDSAAHQNAHMEANSRLAALRDWGSNTECDTVELAVLGVGLEFDLSIFHLQSMNKYNIFAKLTCGHKFTKKSLIARLTGSI